MEHFDEEIFIWSLTQRLEDARAFSQIFHPDWLREPPLRAILGKIYSFLKEFGLPPDIPTLHRVFKDEDKETWELRYKDVLDKLAELNPALPEQAYVLKQAREVAIVRSFQGMVAEQDMMRAQAQYDGTAIMKEVNRWLNKFSDVTDEESCHLSEAVEKLIQEEGWTKRTEKMASGIKPFDEWTNGGLRGGQLGIYMAPTGHGKSVVLMNIAYKMAIQNEMNVWFVTNELTMFEQTERFMSRITKTPLQLVQDDPYTAYHGIGKHWHNQENERLRLTSVNRDISANDIEMMMTRWANISGWKPQVLCLDFMERMKPNERGYDRNQEWGWLGAIARDLVRLAKRHNLIIWTAAQTNRKGMNADEIKMEMGQSSVRHFQEAAAVIGGHKVYIEGEEDSGHETIGMEFFALKMRHGKGGKSVTMKVDLENMMISSEEGKKKIREAEESDDEDAPQKRAPLAPIKKKKEKSR